MRKRSVEAVQELECLNKQKLRTRIQFHDQEVLVRDKLNKPCRGSVKRWVTSAMLLSSLRMGKREGLETGICIIHRQPMSSSQIRLALNFKVLAVSREK